MFDNVWDSPSLPHDPHLNNTMYRLGPLGIRFYQSVIKTCLVSVAQLVATKENLCRGWSSNPKFFTFPHIMCVNLATRLLDKKKSVLKT